MAKAKMMIGRRGLIEPLPDELHAAVLAHTEKLAEQQARSEFLQLRVSPRVKEKLKQLAEYQECSVTELCNEYILDGIENDMVMLLKK